MFVAIVCEINSSDDPREAKAVKVIPIRTGELDKVVMDRIKIPFIATRGEIRKALIQALQDIEKDTKLQTSNLPLSYT